jgi:hypothetical protein
MVSSISLKKLFNHLNDLIKREAIAEIETALLLLLTAP